MSKEEEIRDDKNYTIERVIRGKDSRHYKIYDKNRDITFEMDIKKTSLSMRIEVSMGREGVSDSFVKTVTQRTASKDPYSLDCLMLSTLKMKSVGPEKPEEDRSAFNARLTRQLLKIVGDEILEAPKHRKDYKLAQEGMTREEAKARRVTRRKESEEEARKQEIEERQKEAAERIRKERTESLYKDVKDMLFGNKSK